MFTTLVKAAGGEVPADRQIEGMDMRDFLLGDAQESGRNTILCSQGNRLQAIKWRQWKIHLFEQDSFMSTWAPYNEPHLFNLEWDPREESEVGFPHAWVVHPMAAAAGALLKSLIAEPPIRPGAPDPYAPPTSGDVSVEQQLQIGPIVQYVTALRKTGRAGDEPQHGIGHQTG